MPGVVPGKVGEVVGARTNTSTGLAMVVKAVQHDVPTYMALKKKQKRMNEAEVLAYQAVVRCIWQPIRTLIVYSQVNSQIGSALNVPFPDLFTDIMQRLGSVLSVSEILVGSECAGLDSFSTRWLKDIVLQPCVMLVLVALYYGYERKVADKQTAQKHAAGNVFFVVFFCCK